MVFPNPAKTPTLMQTFGVWFQNAEATPRAAFDAHFRLPAIHPFADGNRRTARLLMSLRLIRGGDPPLAVRPEDRKEYLDALERGSLDENLGPFQAFTNRRLDETLGECLAAVREAASLQREV